MKSKQIDGNVTVYLQYEILESICDSTKILSDLSTPILYLNRFVLNISMRNVNTDFEGIGNKYIIFLLYLEKNSVGVKFCTV